MKTQDLEKNYEHVRTSVRFLTPHAHYYIGYSFNKIKVKPIMKQLSESFHEPLEEVTDAELTEIGLSKWINDEAIIIKPKSFPEALIPSIEPNNNIDVDYSEPAK